MGVVRPPWISKEWFSKCPFNYCDHFGDKRITSKICVVCRDSESRIEKYLWEGKDPYDLKNVFKDVAEQLANVMVRLRKDCERFGIDIDNLPDIEGEEIDPNKFPVYQVARTYSFAIGRLLEKLFPFIEKHPSKILDMITDVLAHSEHYVVVKINRAMDSREEEKVKWYMDEISDSKTSAFLAYLAVKRNSQALVALSRLTDDVDQKERFLEFAKASLDLCELICREFFPREKLAYNEIGCEEYDKAFTVEKEPAKVIN